MNIALSKLCRASQQRFRGKEFHCCVSVTDMKGMRALIVLLVVCTLVVSITGARKRYPDPKTKANAKPKPVKLNTDILPPLQEILESLGLTRFLKDFVKIGVTETRLLVRLTAMDFQLMSMDWDGITKEEISRLKDEIASMIIRATVPDAPAIRPEVIERAKLTYGRVYMPDSVQSYEYVQASFGGPPPIGRFKLEIPEQIEGCESRVDRHIDYHGSVVAVLRGNCTFLAKATNAKNFNASALIVVNTEDRLESPSSGLGVDKNITDGMVLALGDFPVLTFANTTWPKLQHTYAQNVRAGVSTFVDIVPLKCKSGGTCAPLLEEEKSIQDEVSWGTMRTRSTSSKGVQVRSFDFLTSNYGSQLPGQGELQVVLADPVTACTELVAPDTGSAAEIPMGADGAPSTSSGGVAAQASQYQDKVVLVHRGGCRFDTKALHAQNAGARLVVIVDVDDNPLQRVGGMQPTSGFVAIPSVMVTAAAGEHLRAQLSGADATVTVEVIPARDSAGADAWIELAYTEWSQDSAALALQLEGLIQKYTHLQQKGATWGGEIIAWLNRRLKAATEGGKKSIDTDA